jgi:putative two-component system response regulator
MEEKTFRNGRVLIVDDQPSNILLLEMTLQQGGFTNVRSTTDPHAVMSIFTEFQPDILLLDLHMPGLTGFDVMEQLRSVVGKNTYFPILVLTANAMPLMKQQALVYGANDFLTKPFDLTEVLLRTKNLLETRFLHLKLQDQNQVLEVKVRERTLDLEEARIEILERLSLAGEFRDDATGQHTQRVGRASALLARALGLPDEQVELIELAAPLHDVGKIGIADAILLKPGTLTPNEFRVVTSHTNIGGQILSGSQSPLLQLAEQIALTHHECWDGSGYPHGLRGEEIPLAGRIVGVADVFDALTQRRPYKNAWLAEDAAAEIARLSGSKFDPRVADAFLQLFSAGHLQEGATVCEPSRKSFGVHPASQPCEPVDV